MVTNYTDQITGSGANPTVTTGYQPRSFKYLGDYGSINGDGTTSNNAAVIAAAAANAADGPVFVPKGVFNAPGVAFLSTPKRTWGLGQIKDAAGKRAPYFTYMTQAPAVLAAAASGYDGTAFNGDLSMCQFPVQHRIAGAATLGQPVSTYLQTPEASPFFTYVTNTSGWHEGTDGIAGGRTGIGAFHTVMVQAGQGDAGCYYGNVFVTGHKVGATNFLANPAGSVLGGQIIAGEAGVYLNITELNAVDSGFDVASIHNVLNYFRENDTGALSTVWMGDRHQSKGSKKVDVAVSVSGGFRRALDTCGMIPDTDKAVITLAADQRINFNAVSSGLINWSHAPGDEYIEYNGTRSALEVAVNGCPAISNQGDTLPVNYLTTKNANTGAFPLFMADGGDTNVGLTLSTKGTGGYFYRTGGAAGPLQFQILSTALAVNRFSLSGATAGNWPIMSVVGTDANITAVFQGKGSGGAALLDGGGATKFSCNTTGVGFFATAPVAKPTGVAVTAAGVHAALVTLGLIAA